MHVVIVEAKIHNAHFVEIRQCIFGDVVVFEDRKNVVGIVSLQSTVQDLFFAVDKQRKTLLYIADSIANEFDTYQITKILIF